METVIANIKHAIRCKELITIGGGLFSASELQFIVDMYQEKEKQTARHMGADYADENKPA